MCTHSVYGSSLLVGQISPISDCYWIGSSLYNISNGNRANQALSEDRVLRASQENQHILIDTGNSIGTMQQTSSTPIEADSQTVHSSTTGINGPPNSEQYTQEVQLVHSHDRMNNSPAFSYSNSHQFAPRGEVDNKFDEFEAVNDRNEAAEALEDWHRVHSLR